MLHLENNTKTITCKAMIPHKLQLKNFLSYGSELQTIDFSPYHLICLSGKNGHGKSALLDAMTWALWGQARKVSGTAKADEGLLRLGQTQMLVVFDFEFNKNMYRVRREYMRTYGKPVAVLEFGILEPETEKIIPLTDKTIRATQAKIEQTLHLDFNSFVNSAFLRQGNANEFSKKSAKDRKKILANILGLDQFETVRKLAMEKTKQAQSEKQVLSTLQEKREQELQAVNTVKEKIQNVKDTLKKNNRQENELAKARFTFHKKQKQCANDQKKLEMLTYQLDQLVQEEQKGQQAIRTFLQTWRTINTKKHALDDISTLESKKKQRTETINNYQKQFQQQLELKEQLLKTKENAQHIEQKHKEQVSKKHYQQQLAVERLNLEKQALEKRIIEWQKHIEQYDTEIVHIDKKLNIIVKNIGDQFDLNTLPQKEEQFEKRKNTYQHFAALGNLLARELKSLEQKEQLVHGDDPSCPLCEQNLSASRKRFLKSKFVQKKEHVTHCLKRLHSIVPKLKQILVDQHNQITKTKEALELKKTQTDIGTQKQELTNECTKHQTTLRTITQKIRDEQKTIAESTQINIVAQDKTYQQYTQRIRQLEKDLKNNAYNATHYQEALKQLKDIETKLEQREAILKELALQDERKKRIHEQCKLLKENKKRKKILINEQAQFQKLTKEIQQLQKEEQRIEQEQKNITRQKEQLLQEKGSLETQQEKLQELEKEYNEQKKKITQLNTVIEDYQTIAMATGKDGIQALLIEDTIPEIEQEANNLLSKLTNNQSQIFIESLRDLKKGGTKETLDIKISDSIGIRPYELFSGGEAFRIDFALRIAISKLLARRAGTALQTLIIDEGFGSQDEEGLQHIMDAIYKIQDDFSKIIVVSHLSTMKDQFPVHFFVEKKVNGSQVQVIEQG